MNKKEKNESVDKLNSIKEIAEKANPISKMANLYTKSPIKDALEATKNPLIDFIEQQKKLPNVGWYSDMMKATQPMRDLMEAAKISNPLSEFIESQKHISQTMNLASISENIKAIQPYQSIFAQSKTLDFLNSIQSNPALNAVQTINNQYDSIFSSIKEIAEKSNTFHRAITEINSWRFIIDQISLKAIENEDWEFIQNFLENTEDLYSLSEQVLSGKITQDEFLEKSQEKIEINKQWIRENNWWISLILSIVINLYLFQLGSKATITILDGLKEITTEQKKLINRVNEIELQQQNKFSTKENIPVYISFDLESEVVDTIPKGSEIYVSYIEKGWCFINFKKSSESLPIAGWIKEDYLETKH